jgi:antirestriction protein ArdC
VRPDHAAYIASWLDVLKRDKRFIFTTASHGQRAADYLHELQPAKEPEAPEAVPVAMSDSDQSVPDAVAAAWGS